MVYSDTTNKNGLVQTCELLLDLGDTGISGNATLLAQFTNLINRSYDNVCSLILQNEGDYTWDDSNYTDFPIATTDLVTTVGSEQSDYTLPIASAGKSVNTFLRLIKVNVKDAGGHWYTLYPISESRTEAPLENLFEQPGSPKYYKTLASSIILYPAPLADTVTSTGGLKLFFQRDKANFVSTDTSKEPGFPSIYHYLLALEASEAWAAIKGMRQLQFLIAKKAEFIHNLGWGIANRNKDQRQRIISVMSARNSIRE
jgi:hypothetical protein